MFPKYPPERSYHGDPRPETLDPKPLNPNKKLQLEDTYIYI